MEIIFQELNRQLLWYHIIARFQLQFILFEIRVRRLIRASSEIYNLVVFIFLKLRLSVVFGRAWNTRLADDHFTVFSFHLTICKMSRLNFTRTNSTHNLSVFQFTDFS